MPQSHSQVWLHIVFSTKDRRPFLQKNAFQTEMFRMLAHHVKESNCISASVGGYFDHAHLLVGIARTITIEKLVENVKTETLKWAKHHKDESSVSAWQSGYGAFSVSQLSRLMVLALLSSNIGCEEQIAKQEPRTAKANANAEAQFQTKATAVFTTPGIEPKDGEILTNQFGTRFVRIPAAEAGASSDSIPGFFLQETELCYQEWHAAMVAMGEWEPSHSPPDVPRSPIPVGYSINFWHEADAFINKLNRFDQQYNYRMPTEAEWLHACFAGRSQEKPLVRNLNDSQRAKNAFGLYDMLGGNGEFCSNLFVDDAYLTGSEDTQRHANAHVIRGMPVPQRGYRTDTRTPTRRNTDPWLINGLRLVIERKKLGH